MWPGEYLKMKTRLWLLRETEKARLFSRLPKERRDRLHRDDHSDEVWIPRSVIEHQTKFANCECHLTVADWFAEKNDL